MIDGDFEIFVIFEFCNDLDFQTVECFIVSSKYEVLVDHHLMFPNFLKSIHNLVQKFLEFILTYWSQHHLIFIFVRYENRGFILILNFSIVW